ncbi:phosphopantetheine-binding protein [Streptomyces tateyamensis]|uniref:Phosphopantetheine-binding protein n=1 Tax=Streptomyces tateyamensis TaxID=565073 RepID=A0A2V4N595_9ACTN|nr:phosphopantetheine-binding protein [Streptomyces tateyamensis]PYC66973.1 phosphopantetheine-binding protein [Streptomyces tateyamensis]
MSWDQQFEDLLRKFLPFIGADETLTADTDLRDLGLDSLGTVELLAQLEELYGVRFLDDALSLETFATPGVLWSTLSDIRAAA